MRFCLCAEASHNKGMGHLFRMLNFARTLKAHGEEVRFVTNRDPAAEQVLQQHNAAYDLVDFNDREHWEAALVRRHGINVWVNDRLATDADHASRLVDKNVRLVTFDDEGPGAALADIHVAALPCLSQKVLNGRRILCGVGYLILNPEIIAFRRQRVRFDSLLVTIGGSDTYRVTADVVRRLIAVGQKATVITGPGFYDDGSLDDLVNHGQVIIKETVPSLIAEFDRHDLAITAGGITPFEANAAGLPCLIIATEAHEVVNANYLQKQGGALYIGDRSNFCLDRLDATLDATLDIQAMSHAGMQAVNCDGAGKVYQEIQEV